MAFRRQNKKEKICTHMPAALYQLTENGLALQSLPESLLF